MFESEGDKMTRMTRRRKASFTDLPPYYKFIRIRNKGTGVRGYAYILDKPLTDSEKEWLLTYDNTEVVLHSCQYAPELKHDAVIVYDKCIRKS